MDTVVNRDPVTGRNLGRDLTGRVSGQLVVTGPTDRRCPNGYRVWQARCSCGTVIERPSYLFVRARQGQKSCGCGPKGRPRIADQGAHVNALYANYRRAAADRGYAFGLGKAEFRALLESDCAYCGVPPSLGYTHPNLSGVYRYNGIDRADNALGYSPENCVPCCTRCNFAKGDMGPEEFREWVRRVHAHLGL